MANLSIVQLLQGADLPDTQLLQWAIYLPLPEAGTQLPVPGSCSALWPAAPPLEASGHP